MGGLDRCGNLVQDVEIDAPVGAQVGQQVSRVDQGLRSVPGDGVEGGTQGAHADRVVADEGCVRHEAPPDPFCAIGGLPGRRLEVVQGFITGLDVVGLERRLEVRCG